ncbi:MAG: hypothetical protein ACRCTL_16605 [Pseudomonas sp.]
MNILYRHTQLEHQRNEIITKYIFIATEELKLMEEYSQAICSEDRLLGTTKLYAEEAGRTAIVCLTAESYEARIEIARSCKAGVIFINSAKPEESVCLASLAGYSQYEIDGFAAEIGAQIDIKRFVMSVAREVPFTISKKEAKRIVSEAAGIEKDKAVELLFKVLDKDGMSYKRLKNVSINDQISTTLLDAVKPGSQATAELLAYADKIYREGGVHVIEAGLGFGKTQHVIRPILEMAKTDGAKSTLLTHRVSISGSFDDVCSLYSDKAIAYKEDKLESLALVINSVNNERFKLHTSKSDVLVIDEGSQVIAHILQKGFAGDRRGVFHEIINRIRNARLVLIADAFISEILMIMVRKAGRVINYTRGNVDNSQNERVLTEIATAQRLIFSDVAESLKPMIGSDSRKEAEYINSYIKSQGKRVLLVTSDTRSDKDVMAFFKNPNLEMKKYDALVYSPSMQSSISIVEKHFDTHYCLFFGTASITDAKQFTQRDRTAKKVVLGVSKEFRYQLENDLVIKELFSSDDYVFDSVALPFYKNDAKEKNNYRKYLAMDLELDGYKVTRLAPSAGDIEAFKTVSGERRAVKEYVVNSTLAAAKNVHNTCNFDEISEPQNEEQRFHNHALAASRILGKSVSELNEDDIAFYNEGQCTAKLMNARCYMLGDENFKEYAKHAETAKGRDHKSLLSRRTALKKFMEQLGVVDGTEILTAEAMKVAAEYAVKNKDLLAGLGIIRSSIKCKTDREIQAAVTVVLRSMGLTKKQVTRGGVKEYCLTQAVYLRVISYVDKARYKSLAGSNKRQASKHPYLDFLNSTNSLESYREIHGGRVFTKYEALCISAELEEVIKSHIVLQ